MQNTLKIILSGLLLGCLLDMPYGYFQLVRFLATGSFIYLGLNDRNNDTIKYVYFSSAVLFQPFIKIALGRLIWNIVDVIVAGALIMSFVKDYNSTAKIKVGNENE
jgi:Sec-independent protein secretion pathway component TatC